MGINGATVRVAVVDDLCGGNGDKGRGVVRSNVSVSVFIKDDD
jgi:hypothetical protein